MFTLEPKPDLISHNEHNVFPLFNDLGLLKQMHGTNYTHSFDQKAAFTLPVSHLCLQKIKNKNKKEKKKQTVEWLKNRQTDFPCRNT